MRRWAGRLLAAVAVAAGVVASGTPGASAALGEEQIRSYDVTLTVAANGGLHIREEIEYDFGFFPRHGIFRNIPDRTHYDDTYDRDYPLDNIRVTGGADTPTQTERSREGSDTVLKIGDPDRTITGVHTYVIDYDVRGALTSFPEHVELYWNAIGPEWDVPIRAATVRVVSPARITRTLCFTGEYRSQLACDRSRVNGRQATFVQRDLTAFQGVTVAVAVPPGSVTATGPILRERFALERAFAVTPVTMGVSSGLLALVLAGVGWLWWARGRDRRYVGQIPGLEPAKGQPTVVEPRPLFSEASGAVEFLPPEDVRPGQVGTLLDERANVLDVTATIVDLAVRGYLRIDEQEKEHFWNKRDWTLTRLKEGDDELMPYERRLLKGLFESGTTVELSDLKNSFYTDLAEIEKQLYNDAVRAGWFRRRPDTVRGIWMAVGILVIVAGIGLGVLLAIFTHLALIAIPIVLGGIVLVALHGAMPARTAKGGAMLARVLGFKRYLATAEAEQLKFEERDKVFARYLPYAVVFGVTEHWAKVFSDLAAQPDSTGLSWYGGPPGWTIAHFTGSMSSFTTSVSGTIASRPASTGGGSGFSGGSSGGGGGGGGGGSW